MGETITLTAADGHSFSAYRAEPADTPRGGVVVVQEIFGVNEHIRRVADNYASEGYLAIAPAVFDRLERGVEIGYTPDDIARGRELKTAADTDAAVMDCQAAAEALRPAGKVGLVGYCWGGFLAWAAAAKLEGLAASVVYYGGGIHEKTDWQPACPIMLHFGEKDSGIPLELVDQVRAAHPDLPFHIYPADHGFNCEMRGSYDAESAKLARQRTLAFFAEHVG